MSSRLANELDDDVIDAVTKHPAAKDSLGDNTDTLPLASEHVPYCLIPSRLQTALPLEHSADSIASHIK
jgi:hypothetical protein